ncbi:ankyrin repeat-containing domain protein, partial [Mycena leptocephala]
DVLRDLVRRGAHVNVRAEGSTYPTALHLAVSDRRDAELTRMLLVYGANPNIKGERSCVQFSILDELLKIMALQDGTDRTPLHAASLHGDLQIARLLLAHGADPNIQGGEHSTALQAASHAGHLQIAQLLLEGGADVNMHGERMQSALEAASNSGHTEIVELLQEHG